jgi:hypothetical protein
MFNDPWNGNNSTARGSSCRWIIVMVAIFFTGVWVHSLELHRMFQQPDYSQYKVISKPFTQYTPPPYASEQSSSSSDEESAFANDDDNDNDNDENYVNHDVVESVVQRAKLLAKNMLFDLVERAVSKKNCLVFFLDFCLSKLVSHHLNIYYSQIKIIDFSKRYYESIRF